MENKRILIVDDSLVVRTMLEAMILSQWPDWQVVQAAGGTEALALIKQQPFDCITVDYHMPEMDGLTFITEAMREQPDTRFLFITANLQDSLIDTLQTLGVGCIHKPITQEKVIGAMEQLE